MTAGAVFGAKAGMSARVAAMIKNVSNFRKCAAGAKNPEEFVDIYNR